MSLPTSFARQLLTILLSVVLSDNAFACAAFQFFFARGTNERLSDNYGFGTVGRSVWDIYRNYSAPPGGAAAFPVQYNDPIVEMNNPVKLREYIQELSDEATILDVQCLCLGKAARWGGFATSSGRSPAIAQIPSLYWLATPTARW